MSTELQPDVELETLARGLPVEALPEFLGMLRQAEVVALARLMTPAAPATSSGDELLDVKEASARLGMSIAYLYRHGRELPFCRHLGRSIRFSSAGIDAFLKKLAKAEGR